MDVYLMQHGAAAAAEVDPERPLTEVGRHSVSAVAAHARACGVHVDRVVHSGKLRAEQTAAILAAALGCAVVDQVDGLSPNSAVQEAADALVDPDGVGSLAIVGHLPFLERLASLLVAGDCTAQVVAFHNGGLVKLVPVEFGYAVAWAITPEMAPG